GPTGPSGPNVAAAAFANGFSTAPGGTVAFISVTANVTITGTSQKVLVTSHAGLGSTVAGGATSLNLYICYQLPPSPISTWGAGIFGLATPQNQRYTYGMSAVITGLAAGTYAVGLCGSSTNAANWNSNEYSYTTALVLP